MQVLLLLVWVCVAFADIFELTGGGGSGGGGE